MANITTTNGDLNTKFDFINSNSTSSNSIMYNLNQMLKYLEIGLNDKNFINVGNEASGRIQDLSSTYTRFEKNLGYIRESLDTLRSEISKYLSAVESELSNSNNNGTNN